MESVPEERGHPSLNYIGDTESGDAHAFVLMWGANRDKQFDDIWNVTVHKTDFTTQFNKIDYNNIDDRFTARNGHATVYDVDSKNLLMIGGQDSVNNVQYNDLFSLNKSNDLKKVEFDLSEGMPYPRVRNSHTLVRDHKNHKIYVYGGANADDGPLNDLFEFDQDENEWVQLLTSGKNTPDDVPPALEMHTAHIYYDENEKPHLLLVGGRCNGSFSSGIYSLDLDELQWTLLFSMPSVLCSHSSTLLSNNYVVVYGGFDGLQIFDTIRRYDIKNNKWLTYMKPKDNEPSEFFSDGRIAAAMENANDELILLFGGSSAMKDYNDTYWIKVEDLTNDANFSEITAIM
jgi:hypothetical protein